MTKHEQREFWRQNGYWFDSFAHWGLSSIYRLCTKHDPQWTGGYLNGQPFTVLIEDIDPDLAYELCGYLNH